MAAAGGGTWRLLLVGQSKPVRLLSSPRARWQRKPSLALPRPGIQAELRHRDSGVVPGKDLVAPRPGGGGRGASPGSFTDQLNFPVVKTHGR